MPEYTYVPSNFMLEINATEMLNKIHKQDLLDSKGEEPEKKSGRKLTDKQQELLDILIQNPSISRKKLSNLLT